MCDEDNDGLGLGLGTMGKFMEISMGLGMGRQMVNMMNESMPKIPSASQANPQSGRAYYAAIDGKQAGPFSETEIARLINDKRIGRETPVWFSGMKSWLNAENVPEIMRLMVLAPPPFGGTL
jgi:hypothetical protein